MKLNKRLIPVAVGIGDALIVAVIGIVFLSSWWWIAAFAVGTGVFSAAAAHKVLS